MLELAGWTSGAEAQSYIEHCGTDSAHACFHSLYPEDGSGLFSAGGINLSVWCFNIRMLPEPP